MMVVLGVPPVFQIVTHLPVFSSGHNGRLAILALLCLALLAGWGLDDLLERPRRGAVWVAAAIFALPIAYAVLRGRTALDAVGHGLKVAWGFATPPRRRGDHPRRRRLGMGAAGGCRRGADRAAGARPPAAPACTRRARRARRLRRPRARRHGLQPVDPARRGDAARHAGDPRSRARPRPSACVATGDIPQDALPMNHGLAEPRGYDLPVERRYDRLWRRYLSPEFADAVGPVSAGHPAVAAEGRPDAPAAARPARDPLRHAAADATRRCTCPGLRLVHDGPDARLYRSAATQPRAAVVGAQDVVGSGDAALDGDRGAGLRARGATVVTEKPVAGLPPGAAAPGRLGADRARRRSRPPRRRRRRAARRGCSSSPTHGIPAGRRPSTARTPTSQRVDYVMRGVRVGPGHHRVEFRYRPWSFTAGWIVSLAALVALLGALLLWRRGATETRSASAASTRCARSRRCAIVEFHAVGIYARGSAPDAWTHDWVARLDVGVPVFFLLSGFLLYRPFARARAGGEEPRVRAYAWRRVLRIFPGYWVALVVAVLALGLHGRAGAALPAAASVLLEGHRRRRAAAGVDAVHRDRVLRVPAAVGALVRRAARAGAAGARACCSRCRSPTRLIVLGAALGRARRRRRPVDHRAARLLGHVRAGHGRSR